MYDLILNRIFPRCFHFLYKLGFVSCGKKSRINFPRIDITKKSISLGNNVIIHKYARINTYESISNKNPKVIIGDNSNIHYFFSIIAGENVFIGQDVLIASHVTIISENHSIDPISDLPYIEQKLIAKPITICDGVWIGENVSVLPGVTIGKKTIIGANSVVTHSLPPYSIAVGNPAKVIKKYNFKTNLWEKVNF